MNVRCSLSISRERWNQRSKVRLHIAGLTFQGKRFSPFLWNAFRCPYGSFFPWDNRTLCSWDKELLHIIDLDAKEINLQHTLIAVINVEFFWLYKNVRRQLLWRLRALSSTFNKLSSLSNGGWCQERREKRCCSKIEVPEPCRHNSTDYITGTFSIICYNLIILLNSRQGCAEVWWCPGWILDCMPPLPNSSIEQSEKYRHLKYVKLVLTKNKFRKIQLKYFKEHFLFVMC